MGSIFLLRDPVSSGMVIEISPVKPKWQAIYMTKGRTNIYP